MDPVSSPTYVIVNQYRRPDGQVMSHLDAYRLANAMEAEILDVDLMLENGPVIVEWPERIAEVLPKESLWIRLKYTSMEHRAMMISPQGQRYQTMVETIRKQL
jgi:tRNA threonylcarbamoyladenosine biosynthesis protein TsaE